MSKFKVGDKVFLASYGFVTVKRFGPNEVYVVQVEDNQMTMLLPGSRVAEMIRGGSLWTLEAVTAALEFAARGAVEVGQTAWNHRYREYMELIESGDAKSIAKVYRSLTVLRVDKDLSFGERKMLDRAGRILASEAIALGIPKMNVEETLKMAL